MCGGFWNKSHRGRVGAGGESEKVTRKTRGGGVSALACKKSVRFPELSRVWGTKIRDPLHGNATFLPALSTSIEDSTFRSCLLCRECCWDASVRGKVWVTLPSRSLRAPVPVADWPGRAAAGCRAHGARRWDGSMVELSRSTGGHPTGLGVVLGERHHAHHRPSTLDPRPSTIDHRQFARQLARQRARAHTSSHATLPRPHHRPRDPPHPGRARDPQHTTHTTPRPRRGGIPPIDTHSSLPTIHPP